MTSHTNVKKDKCRGCQKFISIHNKVMSCQSCKTIVHSKCALPEFEFDPLKGIWICWECANNKMNRYDPFELLTYDKYDPNSQEDIEDISAISKILQTCKSYNYEKFNTEIKNLNFNQQKNSTVSFLFNNIDGNASNFDTFVSEISQFETTFSIIAIAETNVDACHKNLFPIPNYNSEYNTKILNKKKGSGLGIYVRDTLIFNRLDKYCKCSPHIESLFIQISNTEAPLTVGVVYRPPNGELSNFLAEIDAIFRELPQENVIIMGDFNIDLLAENHNYEHILYGNNIIPTISIATHEKPGCNPSLIDNILINSTCNLLKSGVLECNLTHHSPIFCIVNCYTKQENLQNSKTCPKYDYCESNTNRFLNDIESSIYTQNFQYSEENFETFNKLLDSKIDEHFKTEERLQKSKRNRLVNPWITNEIISSVNRKQYLYKQWKKTTSKFDRAGNNELYIKFTKFRKKLKHTIKRAIINYY